VRDETSASPFLRTVVMLTYPSLQVLSCASSCSGDSALSLAPCMRCDVRWAVLQVGRTVLDFDGLCQCDVRAVLSPDCPLAGCRAPVTIVRVLDYGSSAVSNSELSRYTRASIWLNSAVRPGAVGRSTPCCYRTEISLRGATRLSPTISTCPAPTSILWVIWGQHRN
jgi:hypothetical protein